MSLWVCEFRSYWDADASKNKHPLSLSLSLSLYLTHTHGKSCELSSSVLYNVLKIAWFITKDEQKTNSCYIAGLVCVVVEYWHHPNELLAKMFCLYHKPLFSNCEYTKQLSQPKLNHNTKSKATVVENDCVNYSPPNWSIKECQSHIHWPQQNTARTTTTTRGHPEPD